jgi:glycosyltransferase involved in cell wall biosynthesis
MSAARVVLICADTVGDLMAGPAIRSVELASALAAVGHPVTVAAPAGSRLDRDGVELATWEDEDGLRGVVTSADIIVVFAPVLADNLWLASLGLPLVVDAYDPGLLETLEQRRGEPVNAQRTWVADASRHLVEPLRHADAILVANERQRHLVLGILAATGRLGSRIAAEDPTLERFILTVPFGLPDAPPAAPTGRLRRPEGPVPPDAFIAYWGGGLYSWLDPITLIEALPLTEDPRISAVFLAGPHPTPVVGVLPLVEAARERTREVDLDADRVAFIDRWVPYLERADWLADADVGISLHHAHPETELSFRTRVLDYIWVGLPIVCSSGDVLADLVMERGLGIVVPPDDPAAVAVALDRLASEDTDTRRERRLRSAMVAAEMTWISVARPFIGFCAAPTLAADRRSLPIGPEGFSGRLRRALRIARGRG